MDATPSYWLDGAEVEFEPVDGMPGMSFAQVHGDPATGPSSQIARSSAGFDTGWHTHDYEYEAVGARARSPNSSKVMRPRGVPAGSYYVQPASMNHRDTCTPDGECVFYYHSEGPDTFNPMTPEGEPLA